MFDQLERDLRIQDIVSAHSATVRLCSEVMLSPDALAGAAGRRVAADEIPVLDGLRNAFDWSCGYSFHTRMGAAARNAPSAGGRYPIELLALVPDGAGRRLLHYNVAERSFFERRVPVVDGRGDHLARAADAFGLAPDEVGVILAGVLWRTIERYGVRGYRYCLIETGSIASALAERLRADRGGDGFVLRQATPTLDRLLGLDGATPCLGTMAVPLARFAAVPPYRAAPAPQARPERAAGEEAPRFSPRLSRVQRIHRRGLAGPAQPVPLVSALHGDGGQDLFLDRLSANDFTGEPLGEAERNAVVGVIAGHLAAPGAARGDGLRVVVLGVDGDGTIAAEALTIDGEGTRTHRPAAVGAGIVEVVRRNFQAQDLITRASLIVLAGSPTVGGPLSSHQAFALRCLETGVLTADLYRVATANGIGTTMIGGFTDQGVQELLGLPGFFPIIAQVYGRARNDVTKIDATLWRTTTIPAPFEPGAESRRTAQGED